jgi:DNA-binding response OmpR family regulator
MELPQNKRESVTGVANILCVDDDSEVIALKRAILEKAGHSVASCGSVEDAVRELGSHIYDAVVTDWRLGEESGRRIVQAARTNPMVPVVVVSGYVTEAFQAAEPVADIYLEKPVDPRELVQILETLLQARVAGSNEFTT